MNEIRKILVVRTDAIGDVVLSLPVVTALRVAYAGAEIVMLVHPRVREIVEDHPDLNSILFDGEIQRGVKGFFQLVKTLKESRCDAAVLLHPTLRLAVLLFCARIPIRIGTGYRFYSFLLTQRVREHRKDGLRHEAEYNLSLAKCLHAEEKPVVFRYPVLDSSRKQIQNRLKQMGIHASHPLIVLHPGSRGSALDWPVSHFSQLAGRLVDQMSAAVIVTGGKEEVSAADTVVGNHTGNIRSLAGELTLKELAALLEKADLLVANSTGPLHIGAALGTPVIGLFPPFTPASVRRWGPYGQQEDCLTPDVKECGRCSGRKCSLWNCMERISVEDVWSKCQEKLEKRTMQAGSH
jgi:lipopolysaccharide heptosyltransferase II